MLLRLIICAAILAANILPSPVRAEMRPAQDLAKLVMPPYALGSALNEKGVYSLLNSGGAPAGYVFETEPLAALPGFSGAPINMLVTLDLEGRFLDVRLLDHNEPIFVSGLGEAPFHRFFEQYAGLSISSPMVVGSPYGDQGDGSSLVYLDGVTKATASVRIAHESVMGATLAVAREKMQGIAAPPPAHPDPLYDEALTWQDLVTMGIASHTRISNAQLDKKFADTLWADDDPVARAEPDALYLDLWVVDLGPKSIARAVLAPGSFRELQSFLEISNHDEPILLIESARHGLVSPDFTRNTAPNWLSAQQDGLPVALRDADLLVDLAEGVPDGTAMILRADRRLGFDPSRPWTLHVSAVREHGIFQPEIGRIELLVAHQTDTRFFVQNTPPAPLAPWREALRNRQSDLVLLAVALGALTAGLGLRMNQLASRAEFTRIRLAILAMVIGFIGWWGQGQLSIVTVLAVLRTAVEGGSYAYLAYDPFSLLIWLGAVLGFFMWGRGLFCGWLCPFGALQEFSHHLGRWLRLPELTPSPIWDARLKRLKYVVLAALIAIAFGAPDQLDTAAEVEPFKTAITTFFVREWYYVAYAALWLGAGLFLFKGFCRYVCPLGAVMAIGGLLRQRNWIARRTECGSPCQLCRVKCSYGAIKNSGQIAYDECFQCLDCVTIHNDSAQCVPLILAARQGERRRPARPQFTPNPPEIS